MLIRQITIIGTGLIGGSLGLALKKDGFRGQIVGCDRAEVLSRAKRKRAIDKGISDPAEACRDSEVVVLATPVGGIVDLIGNLASHLSSGALLTDVGSTKSAILLRAQQVFGRNVNSRFIGGHPMAGKENSGIEEGDPNLFRGAVWFF